MNFTTLWKLKSIKILWTLWNHKTIRKLRNLMNIRTIRNLSKKYGGDFPALSSVPQLIGIP